MSLRVPPAFAAAAAPATPVAQQPAEQLRYARWLDLGTRAGMLVMAGLFFVYATGLASPLVPHERLPQLWSLPVDAYVSAAGLPTGWGWVRLAHHGDIANLAGIALLGGCSLLGLLSLLPLYARRGEHAYLALCVAQIVVLLLAASGVLTAGH